MPSNLCPFVVAAFSVKSSICISSLLKEMSWSLYFLFFFFKFENIGSSFRKFVKCIRNPKVDIHWISDLYSKSLLFLFFYNVCIINHGPHDLEWMHHYIVQVLCLQIRSRMHRCKPEKATRHSDNKQCTTIEVLHRINFSVSKTSKIISKKPKI